LIEEVSFTKRVSKLSKDKLVVLIPKDRLDDFGHKDLVKVTFLKRATKKMISKTKIKKYVKILIALYEEMSKDKNSYSESDVQTKLIKPLFNSLGWNVYGVGRL